MKLVSCKLLVLSPCFERKKETNENLNSYRYVCVIADYCSYECSYSSEIEKCNCFNKFIFR